MHIIIFLFVCLGFQVISLNSLAPAITPSDVVETVVLVLVAMAVCCADWVAVSWEEGTLVVANDDRVICPPIADVLYRVLVTTAAPVALLGVVAMVTLSVDVSLFSAADET